MSTRPMWRRRISALLVAVAAGVLAGCLPVLDGVGFRELYNRMEPLPGAVVLDRPPPITTNPAADDRIRALAVARGYRLRSVQVGVVESVGGGQVASAAAPGLRDLIAAAARAGYPLRVRSGFRSLEAQRSLFTSRLGVGTSRIAAGSADATVNAVLAVTAPPGYSKHQSGYAVDLYSPGWGGRFADSPVARWLERDNYLQAKIRGFIPSYPPGAQPQGPDPEPWEYVWVGEPAIRCSASLLDLGDPVSFELCRAAPIPAP